MSEVIQQIDVMHAVSPNKQHTHYALMICHVPHTNHNAAAERHKHTKCAVKKKCAVACFSNTNAESHASYCHAHEGQRATPQKVVVSARTFVGSMNTTTIAAFVL